MSSTLGFIAMTSLLVVPAGAALVLALRSSYHIGARLNVGAALLCLLAAIVLLGARPEDNLYLRVDDFNIYLIVLNNLGNRAVNAKVFALLSRHVSGVAVLDEFGIAGQ